MSTMWAAPSANWLARPPNVERVCSCTTKLPRNRVGHAATALLSRSETGNDDDSIEIGGLGQAVLDALKSNPEKISPEKQQQKQNGENSGGVPKPKKQLSGSDVLWALEKAAAQKKKKRRDPSTSSKSRGRRQQRAENEAMEVDYSNVRPLCIKSEWKSRLDELETRLRELIDT